MEGSEFVPDEEPTNRVGTRIRAQCNVPAVSEAQPPPKRRRVSSAQRRNSVLTGSLCFYAVLASARGRWHEECHNGVSDELVDWIGPLIDLVDCYDEWNENLHRDGHQPLGFVVSVSYELLMPGWERPLHPEDVKLEDIFINILKKQRGSRCKVIGFLPGRFKAACLLRTPINISKIEDGITAFDAQVRSLLDQIDKSCQVYTVDGPLCKDYFEASDDYRDVLAQWEATHNVKDRFALLSPYHLCPILASVACRGGLALDLCSVVARDRQRTTSRAGCPSTDQLTSYLRALGDVSAAPEASNDNCCSHFEDPVDGFVQKGAAHQYTATHAIKALEIARMLRNSKYFTPLVRDAVAFAFPDKADALVKELDARKTKGLSRWTLGRLRNRLDATCMLERKHYNKHPNFRRQLLFDASRQQHGLEIFCIQANVHQGTPSEAVLRTLPTIGLGLGHFSMYDKTMTLLHVCSLEAGRTVHGGLLG